MEKAVSTSISLELDEVRSAFARLRSLYQTALPKVDPALLTDFLSREKATNRPLSYTVEVFTKEGIDSEKAKEYIYQRTGMMPAVFDHGTHYVTNQILTLEMLKEISDSDDVLEVHGNYCGGIGMKGAYYERSR
jgi:hypothetical protein